MLTAEERIENHRQANYTWRKRHPELWNAMKKRYYGKTAYALNYGKKWGPEEDAIVLKHWPVDDNITDHEISELIGRSVGSIQKRRWLLSSK
jgi:hypothetical protein